MSTAETDSVPELEEIVKALSYSPSREADAVMLEIAATGKREAGIVGRQSVRRMVVGPKGFGDITNSERLDFAEPMLKRDLDKRLALQAKDGVAAEVVFPNQFLALGASADTELNYALASLYNDFVHETFSKRPDRFVAAPIILVDDINKAIAEAERCLKLGFRTLLLCTLCNFQGMEELIMILKNILD